MSDDEEAYESGALDSAAVALHELYEAFVRAGFSEDQAFSFVLTQWESNFLS